MLKDEGSHGVGMALGADRKLPGGGPNLVSGLSAVRIVAVAALHQAGIHPVTEGARELRLLRRMTSEAEFRLRFDEHEVHVARFVRTMACGATDAVRQMLGLGEILRFQTGLMALGTDGNSLRWSQCLEADDLGNVASAVNVRLRRTMAGLASMLVALEQRRMRSVGEVLVPDFLVTSLADVGLGVLAVGSAG